mgnify:FL=1|jgi:phosphoribosylglycinamide formyltransferase-1|tara:strand:+ start:451 stop:1026 length:576 start_codon:yes stop_codon:yes gene_type:complete
MKRIVIFASGSGTNAGNIIKYFQKNNLAKVTLVLSNKSTANVLDRAKKLSVPSETFNKSELINSDRIASILRRESPDLIVLAGFLLKFPKIILKDFPNKVINIHPALLPKYGGKGMYGMLVHESVVKNKESESGITIHYVNENYDEGAIIFQKSFQLSENDTSESVAHKIHELEYEFLPKVIEEILKIKDK